MNREGSDSFGDTLDLFISALFVIRPRGVTALNQG
jgi:hypothetical protein